MNTLWKDVRYGLRILSQKPGFTIVAVITLALGIGATTAIFTVVNAVLLQPLPYPDAGRLVSIGQTFNKNFAAAGEPKFIFWRQQSESFDAMAAYSNFGGAGGNLTGGSEPEFVSGLRVSEDFFRVLGVYPAIGRAFTHAEDTPGGDSVAIISDGLWRRRFGSDPSLIGSAVLLNDHSVTVVGVMPVDFRFRADLFVPMQARPNANYDPNATVIGKLKRGVTIDNARAELETIAEKYRAEFPRQMRDNESIGAQPYQETFTGDVRGLLLILLCAVGFLLLIACANVANLQLTRAAARQREIAVRLALGASGSRITRQLLTEGVLLAIIGGGAGLLLAVWGTDLLLALMPSGLLPKVALVRIDWHVLVFALGAAVGTGLLFGSAPSWQARRLDVNTILKEQSGRGGSARGRLRSILVVTEVAMSLVLLIGAGLLIRTFANLRGVAPGFDPNNVLTFQIQLNGERYNTTNKAAAFYRDALARIESLPGVESAAVTNKLPLDWQFNMPVSFPDKPDDLQSVQVRMITPDYFKVMRIGLAQGRVFNDNDQGGAQPAAVVNEAFARRFFDGKEAVGQQLLVGRGLDDPLRQVVGVVKDVKQFGLDKASPAMVFSPIPQMSDKLMAVFRAFTSADFVIRSAVPLQVLTESIKREIAAIDSTLPLSQIRSMNEIAAQSIANQRFNMMLLALFASLGLLLAAVGIYGVVAHSVELRTNEIGIRLALGAQTNSILALVLRHGFALATVGVALGLGASVALTRLLETMLFGVKATDPLTFGAIPVLLILVSLFASYMPARRATKVDPIVALRCE